MKMTKDELVELLESLNIPFNEGIQSDSNSNKFPRIVYFDYIWEDTDASGQSYDTIVTYQISLFSKKPRSESLMSLRHALNENGLRPRIMHEYVEDLKCIHSYLTIEVIESLT